MPEIQISPEGVKAAQKATGSTDAWCLLALQAAAPHILAPVEAELAEARKQMRRAGERLEGIVCEQINAPLGLAKRHRAMFKETGEVAVGLREGQVHYDEEWDQLEARADQLQKQLDKAREVLGRKVEEAQRAADESERSGEEQLILSVEAEAYRRALALLDEETDHA
jgi:multidrug resistance efflux pump